MMPSATIVFVFAVGLILAVAAGWLLRGAIGQPDPVLAIAAASAGRPPAEPPAAPPAPPATVAPTVPAAAAPPAVELSSAAPSAPATAVVEPQSTAPNTDSTVVAAPPPVAKPSRSRSAPVQAELAPKAAAAATRSSAAPRLAQNGLPARRSAERVATTSFDCRRVQTDVNKMICADYRLGALDVAMSDAYRAAVRRGGAEAEYRLDEEQASFLNARASCQTPGCVARLTRRRLDDLLGY